MNNQAKVEESFKWRTARGEMLAVNEMCTRHLFNTLKMIWNHSAPEEYKLGNYNKYKFSSFYTKEYMTKAIGVLIAELETRNLTSTQRILYREMKEMASEAFKSPIKN